MSAARTSSGRVGLCEPDEIAVAEHLIPIRPEQRKIFSSGGKERANARLNLRQAGAKFVMAVSAGDVTQAVSFDGLHDASVLTSGYGRRVEVRRNCAVHPIPGVKGRIGSTARGACPAEGLPIGVLPLQSRLLKRIDYAREEIAGVCFQRKLVYVDGKQKVTS